jgi:hypothetical protein
MYRQVFPSAHTVHLCVLCGSENKQRLFVIDKDENEPNVCKDTLRTAQ